MGAVKLGVIPCMVKTRCIGVWAAIEIQMFCFVYFRKISFMHVCASWLFQEKPIYLPT